ncbi:MAG: ABC transporter ATP-binding protein [Chloroflexota bacterium]
MTNPKLLPSGLPRIESLKMQGIVKRFPGVLANDRVDFDVHAGEIHALLGENGAGKSTLMKILYGLYQPDEGQILLNERPIQIHSPTDSIGYGIGMIHQHFMLVNNLTVAENVALGLKESSGLRLDLEAVSSRIDELSSRYGLTIEPQSVISDLAVGERQRVEIVKALYRGAALLVLDEPTAVLTPQEVDELFSIFRQMVQDGHALIFISHKLNEIFALTDRVTVLRDGRVVGTTATADVTKNDLAQMMVGREVLFGEKQGVNQEVNQEISQNEASTNIRLQLDNIGMISAQGKPLLRDISLSIKSGEILGVAGVSGNGQKWLAEIIAGLQSPESGQIVIDNQVATALSPSQRTERGLSYIPEERMHDGVVKDFTVAENLILQDHARPPFSKRMLLIFQAIARHAKRMIQSFDIKTPSQETVVKNLSGGNIQKVVMARELARKPRVLIAAQPTRGVDIGAIEYIHGQLLQQRSEGLATLLISEDLDEIRILSDRIAVMFDGEIMGIVENRQTSEEELGLMMAGEKKI